MQSIAKLLDPSSAKISPWRRPKNKLSPNAPTPAILTMRVAASGKSYELCRVARAARGGGGSRTPKECRFPDCGPIPGRPTRENCSAKQQALSARLGKSFPINSPFIGNDFPLKARRAGFCKPFWSRADRSPAGISIDFAHAKRLKSLLMRAGDLNRIRLASGRPGPY